MIFAKLFFLIFHVYFTQTWVFGSNNNYNDEGRQRTCCVGLKFSSKVKWLTEYLWPKMNWLSLLSQSKIFYLVTCLSWGSFDVTKLLSIFPSRHWIGWLDYPWRHIMFIKIQVSNVQEQTANMVLVCVGLYSDRLKCCCLFVLRQINKYSWIWGVPAVV